MNRKNNIISHRIIGYYKRRNMRIGLLGGSFDPAHQGHISISNVAIKLFKLNEVWWLINPQNPLKTLKSSPLKDRMNFAKKLIYGKKIRIESLEERFRTKYTYHTLKRLTKCHPGNKFIWIMGADNLVQIHQWLNWTKIFNTLHVAVFYREGHLRSVINSKAANFYSKNLYSKQNISKIFTRNLPAWAFIRIRAVHYSSTKIRNSK